ncbi:alpha/beta fold hydrolase [uncultured Aquincola sp.]|uniref:bifunctional 4-carboxymuconolactone decarboxylase/3-oxoadipate enol-lactonase PcaCD n=1 Tax=uncultured Aquincola sp. TaxID=886556 RepID=UPI0032B10BED
MSSRQDDFDRGLKNRRAVLGDAWVDKSTAGANAFNAEFQDLITRFAWNDIWGRPGLDHTTRRLLVLGMCMGLARWEEFELHCGAAIRGGVPLDTIKEVLMQGAIYCGVPAANTAFKLTVDILKKEGLLPEPAPLTPGPRVQMHHTFSQPQLQVALQGTDSGLPIVLSHALGLDLHMWDGLAAELGKSHPVLRYDHRGHGGSAVPEAAFTMDDLVDDAARLIREWGRGPVLFIGLSMGGMVGQGLAIRHPELVKGVVLANTTSQYPDAAKTAWVQRIETVKAGGMAAVADMVVQRYLHEDHRQAHPAQAEALRSRLLRTSAQGYAAACAAVMSVDWQARLGEVKAPTLVIAGARDAGATPAMAQAIAEQVPGAQLEVLADASHLSVQETPAEFIRLLQAFIERVRQAG